jgi:hypothetical protein
VEFLKHGNDACSSNILMLSGVIKDDPIAKATVTVTIGGVSYTTVADKDGNYTLPVASTDLDALAIIESVDPKDESITMSSIVGSFEKMVKDSDGDGILDGAENPNTDNTPLTTALFVLVERTQSTTAIAFDPIELAESRIATQLSADYGQHIIH